MKRTINHNEYKFSEGDIAIEKLRFWTENPRVHTNIHSIYVPAKDVDYNDSQLQEKIYHELKNRDNVRELRSQIETQGGLTEALIVRKSPQGDHYDVIEGNQRLAACRMNYEISNQQKFTHLPCEIVPADMSDGDVLSFLCILHIHGKDEWAPFEKASFIKRKVEEYILNGCDKEEAKNRLHKESHISFQEIEKSMITIDLMESAREEKIKNFSYYEVLSINKHTKKIIRDEQVHEPENRSHTKVLISAIKEWNGTALEFRGAIGDVFKDSKATKKFLDGSESLSDASEIAHAKGSTNATYNKVRKFRETLSKEKAGILNLDPTDTLYNKMLFEFNKLHAMVKSIHEALEKKRK